MRTVSLASCTNNKLELIKYHTERTTKLSNVTKRVLQSYELKGHTEERLIPIKEYVSGVTDSLSLLLMKSLDGLSAADTLDGSDAISDLSMQTMYDTTEYSIEKLEGLMNAIKE